MRKKIYSMLALLCLTGTSAWAQTTYKVTVKEGTDDAENWTITPAEATTTGVEQGTQVTATYAGTKLVKSVKATKIVPEGINATRAAYTGDGAPALSWKTGDQVSLFPEAWSTTLTLTPMGTLTATSDDASTVLKGTLETLPTVGDKLNLLFPRAEWSYTGQTGALHDGDEAVMKKFDYATAQVTVATAESGKITATGDADFTSQQAIVKFTLKDKESGNAISASSLKIAAAGGKLVQGRGMKKTYFPEGWEPVSSGNKHYLYVETEREIYKDNITINGNDWKNFRLDATYGTDGQLIVGGKYLYRFVFVEDEWSQGTPNQIVEISMYDNNEPWGSPSYIQFEGSIAYTDDLYLIAAYKSSVTTEETGEGDPVMGATYGPLTVTPAAATGELTVALRNELGAADSYSFEATDGDGNKYILSRQDVNFENGKYYEINMSMEKVAADKYVDLSTMTGDYTAQDGDVLTGQLPSQYRVTIAADATVTLFNATINTSSWYPAIECTGNATIVLMGSNVISASGEQGSAIKPYYGEGSTLTIQGNGSLTATGKVGIGSGPWDSGRGNLTIAGGNITAIGKQGAGIGGGEMGYFYGNITISGGTVNATGSNGAAGIGSGAENASCGNILISGGTVNATGGSGAPGIGAGNNGSSCETITITNDVTSVTATKGSNAYNSIGKGNSGWGTCGTITIGGTEYPDGITDSPYTYDPSAAPAGPTLADVFTDGAVVGVAVKNTYDTYTVTGTYSGGSYTSYTKSSNDIEEVTMTKDGNNLVVWIKSDMNSECTLTFNTQDNTYTKSFKAGTGAAVWDLSEFVSITVNGTDITSSLEDVTPAAPAGPTTVTWDFSQLSGSAEIPYENGGVTLSGGAFLDFENNMLGCSGECTFTAPEGKKFTSIVITASDWIEFQTPGWSGGTWSDPDGQTTINFMGGAGGISTIVFTLVETAAAGLTSYTLAESTVGMIVGTDGKAYDVADLGNLPSGVTAAGVVVYKNGANGLAIALTDEASMMNWDTACGENGAAAHTPAVSGCSWKLPSQEEWTLVKNANSGSSLNSAITNAGGTAIPTVHFDHETQIMTGRYWLSTQGAIDESARTWGINAYDEIVTDSQSLKTDNILVRACLAW